MKKFSVPSPSVYRQLVLSNDSDKRVRQQRRIRRFVGLLNSYRKIVAAVAGKS